MRENNERKSGKLELRKSTIANLTMPVRSGIKAGCYCCSIMSGSFCSASGPTCPPPPPPGGNPGGKLF